MSQDQKKVSLSRNKEYKLQKGIKDTIASKTASLKRHPRLAILVGKKSTLQYWWLGYFWSVTNNLQCDQ